MPIDEVQLDKIELAANGDIARFFRHVDSLREEFKDMKPDRDNMNEVSKKVAPVQQAWNQGMATSQSLFVGVSSRYSHLSNGQWSRRNAIRNFMNDDDFI